jgi:hypothetical protein
MCDFRIHLPARARFCWGTPVHLFRRLDGNELNELLQLMEKGEENWTRLERLRRNEIMAKVRRAHPEMDPKVIARQNKTNKEGH